VFAGMCAATRTRNRSGGSAVKAAWATSEASRLSPDGKHVLAVRSSNVGRLNVAMEYGQIRQADLVEFPNRGGSPHLIASGEMGGRPHFGRGAAPGSSVRLGYGAVWRAVYSAPGITGSLISWYEIHESSAGPASSLCAPQLRLVRLPPVRQPDVSRIRIACAPGNSG
jgi:hypothetical protein